MDPIYSVEASASANISFRFSETMQERRTDAQRQNSASSTQNTQNRNTLLEVADIRDWVDIRTNEIAEGLLQNTDRVIAQADRIEARIRSQLGENFGPSISSTQPQNDIRFSMSTEMLTYLQMIRNLSPDKESFDQFLNQIDAYLNGEVGQDQSFDEFLSQIGEQFGFSSVQMQQSFTLQLQGQFVIRNGDEVRVIENIRSSQQTQTQSQTVQSAEPLVFDLDGDGLELTTVEEGIMFDITGTGQEVQTAFVTGDDAFLALDRNGNGTIDSGKELFGDQHGAKNGIEELRKFDDNQDGVIDESDAVFDRLKLFVDRNGDGISQKDELISLQDEGITKISLDAKEENRRIAGNLLAASTYYERNNGSRNQIGEMFLNYFA